MCHKDSFSCCWHCYADRFFSRPFLIFMQTWIYISIELQSGNFLFWIGFSKRAICMYFPVSLYFNLTQNKAKIGGGKVGNFTIRTAQLLLIISYDPRRDRTIRYPVTGIPVPYPGIPVSHTVHVVPVSAYSYGRTCMYTAQCTCMESIPGS